VELDQELRRIADAAVRHAAEGEELAGIVPSEPRPGVRVYVCAFSNERRLDGAHQRAEAPTSPVPGAGHGDETSWLVLDGDGRAVEDRSLVRDAVSIAALYELAEEATGAPAEEPRVATPAELDALAAAAEDRQAFVAAMKDATGTVEELVKDVERGYKVPLS
jgi:hypothetical protein